MRADLRRIVLEVFVRAGDIQWHALRTECARLARERKAPVTGASLDSAIDEVLWDLVVERLATFGSPNGQAEARYPFIFLTEMGRAVASGQVALHDPQEFISSLRARVPTLDDVVAQYLLESVGSFQRGLLFGAAVLCGAAAERELLLLLTAIELWDQDSTRKAQAQSLLRQPRLPSIFTLIDSVIQDGISKHGMPYAVHQGATTHLLSFQEMIRVQRNDAVHPVAAAVSRDKAFLSLQSMPGALEVLERLRAWFR
jgi:hypothetical protein